MCKWCNIQNVSDAEKAGLRQARELFTDQDAERFAGGIWSGLVSVYNLPKDIYNKTATLLSQAIANEIKIVEGKPVLQAVLPSLQRELTENVWVFSAAKTYQQVKQASALLADTEMIKTFADFKKGAKNVFETFNTHHLQAEYTAAVTGTQSAIQWQQLAEEKGDFPLLKYVTAGDDRVRPTHVAMDGIIKPVDDEFWNNYYPPNGWRCRCRVEQLMADEGEPTDTEKLEIGNDVPTVFQMNNGKQKLIYSDKHPYFEVADRDKGLATNNFNLEIPTDVILNQ